MLNYKCVLDLQIDVLVDEVGSRESRSTGLILTDTTQTANQSPTANESLANLYLQFFKFSS
jgi:hypothetical protein